MKRFLFDTNIVIYAINKVRYIDPYRYYLENSEPAISFITVAELYEGAFRAGVQTKTYHTIVNGMARYNIVPFSEEIGRLFGQIRYERRFKPISVPDALIAATAMAYDLPLVTHNAKDFAGIEGLNLITEYRQGE